MRSLACLLVLAATAHADTLAVIDLGVKDSTETKVATELTTALRGRTKGRFKTGATPKAIAAAIAKADCAVLERACAAAVGDILGVDYVLVGDLDRRGTRHIASLSLISVKSKQRVRSLADTSTGADTDKWSKSLYARIADVETTDLKIYANATEGEVSIDGQVVAALFNSTATISAIALGSHRLAIKAKGFKAFDVDVDVTLDGGTQSFLLDPD